MEENNRSHADEISLRDLIVKTRSFADEVMRYWYIPAVCILLGLCYQGYTYFTYEAVYPAVITFSVDEDEGGSATGLTGILGQFGLGSVRPSRYNLDKILALSKSRRVIEHALFSKASVDQVEDYLANHLIREYDMRGGNHQTDNDSVVFVFTHNRLEDFNRQENELLMNLYGFIIGPPEKPEKALMRADYNEDTNIMSIEVSTTNEELSLALSQHMFESLSEYYIQKAIEKQLKTFTVMGEKKDSVLTALKSAEYQLANFKDTRRGLLMRTDQIAELRLQREIAALSAMYAEVVKNVEVADFSLKNKMPFIQVIDAPLSPIPPVQLSLLRKLLMGILLGGFIGSAFVIVRSIFRDAVRA